MPIIYSDDLRSRVLSDILSGMSCRSVARKYQVSHYFTNSLKHRHAAGLSTSRPRINNHRSKLRHYHTALLGYIDKEDDITLSDMQDYLSGLGVNLSINAIWSYLKKQNISYKKNSCRKGTR